MKKAANFETCENACRGQDSCVAVTFVKSSNDCRMFTDAGEYFGDPNADTSVKRQAP